MSSFCLVRYPWTQAMNPFESLPIYTEEQMAPYKGKNMGAAPPHVADHDVDQLDAPETAVAAQDAQWLALGTLSHNPAVVWLLGSTDAVAWLQVAAPIVD